MSIEALRLGDCASRKEEADLSWLPFLLQTADALFPTGAYAHSLGFEEIVRLGLVHDEGSLREFLRGQLIPALRELELPYLRFAFDAAVAGDLDALCAIDREISAWKLARETREASAQFGVRRLKALRVICCDTEHAAVVLLANFEQCVERTEAHGHHLVVCGLQAAVEGVPLAAALTAYAYQSLAAICAAALKLIRIGQEGCQRVLRAVCAGEVEKAVASSLGIACENAGWFNPLLEIASMRHERATERLFIS
jgi:urease accessory protein